MGVYRIRAHHGMCLAYFRGKGYSEKFIKNMDRMKRELENNPEVCIVDEADDIFSHCPNNVSGVCTSMDKVADYDHQVLALCGLETGVELKWKEFEGMVKDRILETGKRKTVCGDCQWNDMC